jgi:hypothetical protein
MRHPKQVARLHVLPLLLLLLSGCGPVVIGHTIVKGQLEPEHFQFVTIVPKRGKGAGGWRAACVHAHIRRTTGESYICKFGVEMPIENRDGPISTPLAQRVAAECANHAAYSVFKATTPGTPLILACHGFIDTYDVLINNAIGGAHATKACHKKTTPYEFGF